MLLFYLQMIETEEEKSKFESIYQEYKGLLYHIAEEKLPLLEDREDAVHQAFVKVAEHIKKIEPVSPKTKQYVVVIIDNICNDYWRAQKRQPELLPYDDEICTGPCQELDLDGPLAKCIHQLPDLYRNVILLKYHHGYTLKEISDMLNISLSWAQKIDQRAKKALGVLYQEKGGDL